MQESVVIIGAGGHGKVVADIVLKAGDHVQGFLDDNFEADEKFIGFPILGRIDDFINFLNAKFVIAIGNAQVRENIAEKLQGVSWYTAIHPKAVISEIDTLIGEGTVVMAEAVINASAKIGMHCIINTGAIVEHDNYIENFVHVSVGARLAGNVHIGKKTWIGIGVTVSNNISICDMCMIGAGAVVVDSIEEKGVYIGIPSKKVKDNEYFINQTDGKSLQTSE